VGILGVYELLPGDVLVKQGFEDIKDNKSSFTDKLTSGFILGLQVFRYVMSPWRWKTDNPKHTHIAMYAGDGVVYEEGLGGIQERGAGAIMYEVFRYGDQRVSLKALSIMKKWYSSAHKHFHTYGIAKFPGVLVGASNYGIGARFEEFSEKNLLRFTGGMVCSEAVIKAYQDAAKSKGQKPGSVMDLHASRTSPMRMEGKLRSEAKKKNADWSFVGTVRRSTIEHAKDYGDIPELPAL